METIVKSFQEFTVDELYDVLKLRCDIFVVEQNCAYLDMDDVDKDAYHVFFKEGGEIVAYLRVVDQGKRLDEVSIGRVVVARKMRRTGIGSQLMKVGIQVAKEKFQAKKIKIGAQLYAKSFYEQSGFTQISDVYDEDGIPHIYMQYKD